MSESPKVLIVEDQVEYQKELKNSLADAGFCGPNDVIDSVGSVDAAIEVLEARAKEIDLILLDLNLPMSSNDSSPEKLSGKRILDVAKSLNASAGVSIKVLIVSGEDMIDVESTQEVYRQHYADTLLEIVQKADLADTIQNRLQLFFQDPLRDRILKAKLQVLEHYDNIRNPEFAIKAKLDEACSLVIRLLRNEMDHTYMKVGASEKYADKLNDMIFALKKERFKPVVTKDRRTGKDKDFYNIISSNIDSPGGWEAFLWRGSMEQHLQTLRGYRNDYVHIKAKPFQSTGKDHWEIPGTTLASLEKGKVISQIVELIVMEILEWYLPWHEQVFVPWKEKQR